MCGLVEGFAALQALSVASSYSGQRQAASAQDRYQRQLMAAEQSRQKEAETHLRMRQQDEQESRARELAKVSQEARAIAARNITASGEAGVSGASVDALLAEGTRKELDFYETLNRQGQIQSTAYDREIEAGRKGSRMRMLDFNRPITRPSFANLLIDAGRAGFSTYDFAQRKHQIDTRAEAGKKPFKIFPGLD